MARRVIAQHKWPSECYTLCQAELHDTALVHNSVDVALDIRRISVSVVFRDQIPCRLLECLS